ncbi:MAG: hypothetical protein JWL64_2764, partial [Frankiales bacterium]|nr:hypothetical protein [Frankiales bacterium]
MARASGRGDGGSLTPRERDRRVTASAVDSASPAARRALPGFTHGALGAPGPGRESLIATSVRGGLLVVAPVVAVGVRADPTTYLLIAVVLGLALVASRRELRPQGQQLCALAEVAVAASGVALSTESFSPLLVCLPAG